MLLKDNLVEMKWHPTNRVKYVTRGYKFTAFGEKFYAKASDVLELSSGAKIPVHCDYCGKIYYPTSRNYEKSQLRKEKDCCVACKGKEIRATAQKKYGVNNVVELNEVRMKMKETCLSKYGVSSPLENEEIYQQKIFYLKYLACMLKWLRVTLRNLVIFRDFRSNYRKKYS